MTPGTIVELTPEQREVQAVCREFALNEISQGWGKTTVSLTFGYGNGLFKNDGGLGTAYASNSWSGAFGGVKVDFYPTQHSTLSFMAENNAWDYNLGG